MISDSTSLNFPALSIGDFSNSIQNAWETTFSTYMYQCTLFLNFKSKPTSENVSFTKTQKNF